MTLNDSRVNQIEACFDEALTLIANLAEELPETVWEQRPLEAARKKTVGAWGDLQALQAGEP